MEGTMVFQRLFDTLGLDYKNHTLKDVHEAYITKNSVYQKQCGILSLSIERIEKAIEDFDIPPLSLYLDKRERIAELETNKNNAEQQLELAELEMERLAKVLKDIENLYKCYEPSTYYSFHTELKPVSKAVSPDLFKDTEEIEDYTPEEIDGSNLVWSVPFVNPKQQSYSKFVCPHCHSNFASKQKLQQHLRKKKKCTDNNIITKSNLDTDKPKYVCNHCSKEFSQQAGLSRHKACCQLRFKQTTQDALRDNGFKINRFNGENVEFNKDSILKRMSSPNYFLSGDVNGARQLKRLTVKYSRKTVVDGIKSKFFNNPSNYSFYVSNVSRADIKVLKGKNTKMPIQEMKVADLIDHMVEKVVDSMLDAIDDIRDFDTTDDDGAEVCDHELYNFLIDYRNNADDDAVSKRYFTNEVKLLLTEYKDDIKQIWKHMNLI